MQAPGFWDDQDRAAKANTEYARAKKRLDTYRELEAEVDEFEGLAELVAEDPELAAEFDDRVTAVEAQLAELEEQRLFAGEYDAGDALVTINAGAGGTDAQDWAEMVLRMEMRWAEKRGFDVELLEASPGEEAGIKSATFQVKGENAYGLYAAEKGVHRLVRLSARSTPSTAARRRSPASRSRRSSRTPPRSRSTTTTCRSTPTARRARAASTSTRPTPRCASPTGRAASSCSARTSARSRRTRRRRWRCSARSCSSSRSGSARRSSRARRARRMDVAGARRSARTSCTRTRWSRTTARTSRWATPTACSTATSTASCAPSCTVAPRRRLRGVSEQPTAPYLDAVIAYGFRGSGRFHVPGHKGGLGRRSRRCASRSATARSRSTCRRTSTASTSATPTPFQRAERLAAEAYGASARGS